MGQVQAALHLPTQVEEDKDGRVDVGRLVEDEHRGGGEEAHLGQGEWTCQWELREWKPIGELEEANTWSQR